MTQMMHAIGLGSCLIPAILVGRPAVLLPAFEPGAVLDAIERFRCTFTIGLPALMQFVVEEQARNPRDVSSLRIAIAAGDRVPVALRDRFAVLFGIQLQEGMGLTETFAIAYNPKGAIRPGSVGLPKTGVQLSFMDADGDHLEPGDVGEIVVRSPANCIGYWNDPAATEALFRGGWLRTGDLGSRDPDGYVWCMGRRKEIIVHGGSNVCGHKRLRKSCTGIPRS